METIVYLSRRGLFLSIAGGMAACAVLTAPEAAAADTLAKLRATGLIRVGNGIFGTKPYAWQQDGHYEGYEYELLVALLKTLGIAHFKYVITDWTTLIPGLKADRWDIIFSGMAEDVQRAEGGGISYSRPYAFIYDVAMVKDSSPYTTVASLKGKVVGTVLGTVDSLVAHSLVREGIVAKVLDFNTYGDPFLALQQNRVAAVILDQFTYAGQKTKLKDLRFIPHPFFYVPDPKWKAKQDKAPYRLGSLAIGVRREDTPLLEAINKGLDELDKQGVRKAILEKYMLWDKYQTLKWMLKE